MFVPACLAFAQAPPGPLCVCRVLGGSGWQRENRSLEGPWREQGQGTGWQQRVLREGGARGRRLGTPAVGKGRLPPPCVVLPRVALLPQACPSSQEYERELLLSLALCVFAMSPRLLWISVCVCVCVCAPQPAAWTVSGPITSALLAVRQGWGGGLLEREALPRPAPPGQH